MIRGLAKLTKGQWMLALVTAAYVLAFTSYFLSIENYEFLWYVLVAVFFFGLIFLTISRTNFTLPLLCGLSVWGFLHMAGGGIRVGGDVLYAYVIFPFVIDGEFTILKYDQVVHFYGFFIATYALYQLFKPRWSGGPGLLATASALGAMGLGALNELVEFSAVLAIAETGVGGYYNTGLDIVCNTLGAASMAIVLYIRDRRRKKV